MSARAAIAVGAGIGLLVALLAFLASAQFAGWGGYGPPYGPYMMGRYGPGMMYGYGPGYGTTYGAGYGSIEGPAAWYGVEGNLNLSSEAVKNYFERWITVQDNPRLKVGEVKEKDADTIEVDVVTKQENALVQRFMVNRHTGFYRSSES